VGVGGGGGGAMVRGPITPTPLLLGAIGGLAGVG